MALRVGESDCRAPRPTGHDPAVDAEVSAQALEVIERRRVALAQHLVHFRLQDCLRPRSLPEQVEGPGERDRGGFVAGEKERHQLIAQLAVGHARAGFLVACFQQHGQQVVAGFAAGAALGDDPAFLEPETSIAPDGRAAVVLVTLMLRLLSMPGAQPRPE